MTALYTVSTGGAVNAADINQFTNALTTLQAPIQVGSATTITDSGVTGHLVALGDDYVAMTCGSGNATDIYDLSIPASPTLAARIAYPGTTPAPKGLVVLGGGKYLGASVNLGYSIYDVSSPTNPAFAANLLSQSGAAGVIAASGRTFVNIDSGGNARAADMRDAISATTSAFTSLAGRGAVDAVIHHEHLLSLSATQVIIDDITDRATLGNNTTFTVTAATGLSAIALVSDRYAALADQSGNQFFILDIGNPRAPTVAKTQALAAGSNPADVLAIGTRYIALACYGSSGAGNTVQIWDISTPTSPTLAQTISCGSGSLGPSGLCLLGQYLVVTLGTTNQIQVWNLSSALHVPALAVDALEAGPTRIEGDLHVGGRIMVEGGIEAEGSVYTAQGYSSSGTQNTPLAALNLAANAPMTMLGQAGNEIGGVSATANQAAGVITVPAATSFPATGTLTNSLITTKSIILTSIHYGNTTASPGTTWQIVETYNQQSGSVQWVLSSNGSNAALPVYIKYLIIN